MIRFLLINDTSKESNPGCRAASSTFLKALRVRGEIVSRIPVGNGAKAFAALEGVRRRCVIKDKGAFSHYDEIVTEINVRDWQECAEEVFQNDPILRRALEDCDEIVVNAEGTIHHNLPRAVSLLGLIAFAGRTGKPLLVINATVMAMDPNLLREAFRSVTFVHVRESDSQRYLQSVCPNLHIVQSPDLAFGATPDKMETDRSFRSASSQGVLFTTGVFGTGKQFEVLANALGPNFEALAFLAVGDGGEAQELPELCNSYGIRYINCAELDWWEVLELLKGFELVVSGRHHINIFAMLANRPLIALPSNTWKIKATLADLGHDFAPVATHLELRQRLEFGRVSNFASFVVPERAVRSAINQVNNLTGEIANGNYHSV
jgi:hypothetical protein